MDGTTIGEHLGVTRAAVWKTIKKMQANGIDIKSIQGKGYVLASPFIALDPDKIKSLLSHRCVEVDVLQKIDSTNSFLRKKILQQKNVQLTAPQAINPMQKPMQKTMQKTMQTPMQKTMQKTPQKPKAHENVQVALAEMQTAGRGRLGRAWHSPFGENIYLSLKYSFAKDVSELSGLSLVLGLAVCDAIEAVCPLKQKLMIKWPNDIYLGACKLAGLLVEMQIESHGLCHAVIGLGINVNMQLAPPTQINQSWASLTQCSGEYHDRNTIAASIIDHMIHAIDAFCVSGFRSFTKKWQQRDYLYGKDIHISQANTKTSGKAKGINQHGHIILQKQDGSRLSFSSGDATLRL